LRKAVARVSVALVLGGALCLQDDLALAAQLVPLEECAVVAVNDAGFWYPGPLTAWVSMHAEEFPERERIRSDRGYPGGYTRWTRPYPAGMKHLERHVDGLLGGWNGSSGLLGVGVAIVELGADPVMLCGIPLDDRAHFNRKGRWEGCYRYRLGWEERMTDLCGRVRSFSGWTREVLGEPTREWMLDRLGATV
jgi:hypothetical protein